ncbi:MAG: glycosyltransferase family 39 protein [Chloroflexota bacterium]
MEQENSKRETQSAAKVLLRMLGRQTDKRFVAVYLLSLFIDLATFRALIAAGVKADLSQIASFFLGVAFFFTIGIGAGIAVPEGFRGAQSWRRFARFLTVSFLALSLRSAVHLLLITNWNWQPQTAILVAIPIGAAVLYSGIALCAIPGPWFNEMSAAQWRCVTIAILAYALVLKLVFMGAVNLIPEEAYYWNYAQHLDLSYLDHPPMVAWLIWLSTSLFGKSELSVRLPAFGCWAIAALFIFRLTLNLFDRTTAYRVILLLAVLPIYFGLGFFMTPDAPLYAAWVGCLYFLHRVLLDENKKAWWGVGVCMGIGMLSKYTVALLGLATLVFVLVDRQARRWLLRYEPYLAAMVALTIFTPVLVWNMKHGWVSFMFQGPDRWEGSSKFYLHILIGTWFLILTPTALLGIARVLWPRRATSTVGHDQTPVERRRYLWVVIFTIVPLSVFVFFSLRHQVKLNWTAPIWLAAIPMVAWDMVPHPGEIAGAITNWIRRIWMPTVIALLITLGASFYYISLGLPGAGPASTKRLFGPWRQLGEKVGAIDKVVEVKTKSKPIIVGMDRNFISSLLSFYDFGDNDAVRNTGGPHFFGGQSLMWAYWLPASEAVGRNFLMVAFDRRRLADRALLQYFDATSDVSTEALKINDRVLGYFYWRVGYRYRGLGGNPRNIPAHTDTDSTLNSGWSKAVMVPLHAN